MRLIHFLNVNDGDCNIIQHANGHVTVIDVCNAAPVVMVKPNLWALLGALTPPPRLPGDFRQKDFPVNPIEYMKERNINEVFRFVLTHPDMDHMDGIKEFFRQFPPTNFWDTNNNKTINWKKNPSAKFNEEDWKFYLSLRDGANAQTNPRRLTLHSDERGQYYNVDKDGNAGGDGLYVLAPTPDLVSDSNQQGENYHGCSYVILYKTGGHRILFGGDSHDETWEHILASHKQDVSNVDLLIAPHHGRSSNRSYEFLKVVNPKLTLFGNAPSEHLAYDAFNSRNLPIVTNNEAGSVLIDAGETPMVVYVTNQKFAEQENEYTFPSPIHEGYHYLLTV